MENEELIYVSVVKPVVFLDYDDKMPYDVYLDKYDNDGFEYLSKFQDGLYIAKQCFGVSKGVTPYYFSCFKDAISEFSIKSGYSFDIFLNFKKYVGEFDYVAAEQMLAEFEDGERDFKQSEYNKYYGYYCETIKLLKEAIQIKGAIVVELK